MGITVRRVCQGDEKLVTTLFAQAEMDVDFFNAAFFADQDNILLLASCNNQPCGFLYAYLLAPIHRFQPQMFLYSIDVFPEYRKQGIGSALIEALKELALDMKCEEIFVFTNQNNGPAMALYEHTGGVRVNDDDVMFIYPLPENKATLERRIEQLSEVHLDALCTALRNNQVHRAPGYFQECLAENKFGKRTTYIALAGDSIAGFVHVKFESDYPPFRQEGIPEVNDLWVFSEFRQHGVGRALIMAAEKHVSATHPKIGLGVGLYGDYGSAQRLYPSLGYVPDGRGVIYKNKPVEPGSSVKVDDDLLIYLVKTLSQV